MRKIILVLFAFVLFVISALLVVSLSAYSFLYPGLYIDSLRDAGAFEYAENQLQNVPSASFIKIPEGGVEALAVPLITNFLSYVRSENDELKLEVEIDSPKLKGFFLDSVERVPICRSGQNYSFDDLENLCRPADKSAEVFLDELLEAKNLSFFAKNTTDLAEVYGIEEGSAGRAQLDKFRGYVRYYQFGVLGMILIFVLILVGIYFVDSGYWKGSMRWAGVPLLIAGLFVLIFVFYGTSLVQNIISDRFGLQVLNSVLDSIIDHAIKPFYSFAGGASILGLCLVVVSFFMPNPNEKTTIEKKN